MSDGGGAYEYVCHSMAHGDIDKFVQWSADMLRDLYSIRRIKNYYPRQVGTVEEAHARLDEAIQYLELAASEAAALQDRMRNLAGLAKALEWYRSGDFAEDAVVQAAANLGAKMVG